MKKIIFLIALLLLPQMLCYGYESINISPEYINQSTSKVSLNYTLKSDYPIYNFTMGLKSDGILFEKNSTYIPYIKKNNIFYINTTGSIANNSMDEYLIVVDVKYILRDTPTNYVKLYTLYRINNTEMTSSHQKQVEIINNVTNISIDIDILENHTEENISNGINYTEKNMDNITDIDNITEKEISPIINVSTNINENNIIYNGVNNKAFPTNNTSEKIQDGSSINHIFYAILGIISGVITALIIIYVYTI